MVTAVTVIFLPLLAYHGAYASSISQTVGNSSANDESPMVHDPDNDITYLGVARNGIELFLNVPFGADTGGERRFQKPQPAPIPEPGSVILAQDYGPVCPQKLRNSTSPIELSVFDQMSEDCLNLNIARPRELPGQGNNSSSGLLPVMVWIYGGSYWVGWNGDLSTAPDGLVLQAEDNGTPILHVAMNYRLGVFGFAQSEALRTEGSLNAGLLDQRLGLEWVRDNIAHFGGDPNCVTIFGQSSGGVSVGMHLLAYGGTKPAPFHHAIAQSQALALGITANYTRNGMLAVAEATACNQTNIDSPETVACLRSLDTSALQAAAEDTWVADGAHNGGDLWLPTVDGDFLPAPPSQLIREGRFVAVPRDVRAIMMGWTDEDTAQFTDPTIQTAKDTRDFIAGQSAGLSPANLDTLMGLYPVSEEFWDDAAAGLSAEFYRAARILRDMMMVCPAIYIGSALATAATSEYNTGTTLDNPDSTPFHVYLYDWNQTVLGPALQSANNETGLGSIHTSEYAYIFGNLSRYDVEGYAYAPADADWVLEKRGSRSWAAFATTGRPGTSREGDVERDDDIFQGFEPGFGSDGKLEGVYVVGGPNQGWGSVLGDDRGKKPSPWEISAQRLEERCAFLNSDEVVAQLQY